MTTAVIIQLTKGNRKGQGKCEVVAGAIRDDKVLIQRPVPIQECITPELSSLSAHLVCSA